MPLNIDNLMMTRWQRFRKELDCWGKRNPVSQPPLNEVWNPFKVKYHLQCQQIIIRHLYDLLQRVSEPTIHSGSPTSASENMFQIKEAGTESGTAERRADSGVLQISLLAYPELGDVKRTYSMSASDNNNEEPHVSLICVPKWHPAGNPASHQLCATSATEATVAVESELPPTLCFLRAIVLDIEILNAPSLMNSRQGNPSPQTSFHCRQPSTYRSINQNPGTHCCGFSNRIAAHCQTNEGRLRRSHR